MDFVISEATADAARRAVHQLLAAQIDGVSPGAVPATKDDGLYAPIVLQAKTADDTLAGALLSSRAPMAVDYFTALAQGMEPVDYEQELDRVANLDLVAVAPEFRRLGLGSRLLAEAEGRLSNAGTKIWYGGIGWVPEANDAARFFEARGFSVLQLGKDLPAFLGRRWTIPHTPNPQNWFYKRLR
jgi:ribosomal protein S18 acetylase RimI-like enzyme